MTCSSISTTGYAIFWRKGTVYKRYSRKNVDDLYQKEEQPLAIMVPAWQEFGVIDKMAELAASRLDYENYQIFCWYIS